MEWAKEFAKRLRAGLEAEKAEAAKRAQDGDRASLEQYYAIREKEIADYERSLDEAYKKANITSETNRLGPNQDKLAKTYQELAAQPGVGGRSRGELGAELEQPLETSGKVIKGRTGIQPGGLYPDYRSPPKTLVVVDPRGASTGQETLVHERMHRQEYLPLAQDYGPGGRIPGTAKPPERPRVVGGTEEAKWAEAMKRYNDEQRFQRTLNSGQDLSLLDALRMNRSVEDEHAAHEAYLGYRKPR